MRTHASTISPNASNSRILSSPTTRAPGGSALTLNPSPRGMTTASHQLRPSRSSNTATRSVARTFFPSSMVPALTLMWPAPLTS